MAKALDAIDVAVLAGGLGTRLATTVPGLPKALAPVATRPFVEYLLDWLGAQGATRIVFLLGHRAEQLETHLANHPRAGIAFETSIEPKPLGTGGALGFARAKLRSDPVLVVNGDTFVDADLAPMVAAHRSSGSPATLLAVEVADAARYGRLDIAGGRLQAFVEKDANFKGPAAINAGVYLLSQSLLDKIAAQGPGSLERDVFATLPPATLGVHRDRTARFVDIGTPESWQSAASIVAKAAT
ncbi:MAG: nucleotidyltransferase family protein [Telmatospirillum sp.]|nr:nucleotidyltransferase family protein [Telmatospirillum sp.]